MTYLRSWTFVLWARGDSNTFHDSYPNINPRRDPQWTLTLPWTQRSPAMFPFHQTLKHTHTHTLWQRILNAGYTWSKGSILRCHKWHKDCCKIIYLCCLQRVTSHAYLAEKMKCIVTSCEKYLIKLLLIKSKKKKNIYTY